MARSSLPPGFRFHPTDIELLLYYLKRKIMGKPFSFEAIPVVELYKFAPWDLPDKSCLKSNDLEWYFFCPRDRKYANGPRTNRATDIGYWKTTGKDRHVICNSRTVGMKKTLIFHIGKSLVGDRTDWVMYEYRLGDKELINTRFSQDSYVLCKIFQKSGLGPKNGEQYGAPFKEDEWGDDSTFEIPSFAPPISFCLDPSNDQFIEPGSVLQPEASQVGEAYYLPDFTDDNGILLEQLEEILNSSPLHSGEASGEMLGVLAVHANMDEIPDIDFFDDVGNQYPLQPQAYVEINDLCFIGPTEPSGLLVDDPFSQYPVSNPNGFDTFDYQFTSISEMDAFESVAAQPSTTLVSDLDNRTDANTLDESAGDNSLPGFF